MMRRPLILPAAVLLLAGLAALPACKKSKPNSDTGSSDSTPGPAPFQATSSDFVVFAHLNAKAIRDSALFAEVKEAFGKADGKAEWDKVEGQFAKEIGIKPTDIDAVTAIVTEIPPRDMPKFVLILTSAKSINKAGVLRLGPQAMPDPRGFYQPSGAPGLIHFPDDKTLVLLHPDLAQKYLEGYAKNRTGWPMNSAQTRAAAAEHTLYAVLKLDKVPREMFMEDTKEFAPALAARTITLMADLKGKEVSVSARAAFTDAGAAGKAKESVNKFIGMAVGEIGKFMNGKEAKELSALMPAIQEAHRALKAAKVEVSGSDLVIAGSYKADFDIAAMVATAVPQLRESAEQATAQNNLRQIGLALHSHSDAYNLVPILGVGANGAALRNANEKPLLSWRVAMLPFLEQDALYREFRLNEPWDSEHNKKLIEKMPKVFAAVNKPGKPGYTHLQMVVGPNAQLLPVARIPASFPDGTSNTVAVIEAAEPVIWTKPDDVMLPGNVLPKDLKKKFGGLHPGGFNVVMWDGSVRFIRDTVSDRTLGLALNPRDGQVLGNDW